MTHKSIHRGEILKQAIADSGRSVKDVVNKAGYKTRASYYAHIDNADLPFSILEKYARALNHDFSSLFPEMPLYKIDNEQSFSFTIKPKTIEEAILQRDMLRDKYYDLLEKYSKLLEQQGLK